MPLLELETYNVKIKNPPTVKSEGTHSRRRTEPQRMQTERATTQRSTRDKPQETQERTTQAQAQKTQRTKQTIKLTKLVETQTTVTGEGDSNTVSGRLKFVSFPSTIDQVIMSDLQVR